MALNKIALDDMWSITKLARARTAHKKASSNLNTRLLST